MKPHAATGTVGLEAVRERSGIGEPPEHPAGHNRAEREIRACARLATAQSPCSTAYAWVAGGMRFTPRTEPALEVKVPGGRWNSAHPTLALPPSSSPRRGYFL